MQPNRSPHYTTSVARFLMRLGPPPPPQGEMPPYPPLVRPPQGGGCAPAPSDVDPVPEVERERGRGIEFLRRLSGDMAAGEMQAPDGPDRRRAGAELQARNTRWEQLDRLGLHAT